MLAPFDTNLLKYSAQHLQSWTEAERGAARLTPKPRPIRRWIISWWLTLTSRRTCQLKPAPRDRTLC
ncbi:hypothetical protein DEA8626_00438 [Defluviimonas aquaemixtae]|uniref:Uncharacterized protein n=1 Tax=Albidovulum aquaemixtae TaxID=1542388 RepID=A0A2R8B2S1_9RHOB|nr:hypothetical protein DEA8626_00438 [Defluviimonas aquaemixtae]